MLAVLRRLGSWRLLVAQLAVVVAGTVLGGGDLELPGGQPTPALLALLVVGAVVSASPVAVRLTSAERQASRGGLAVRALALATAVVLLASNLVLVASSSLTVGTAVVWVVGLWSLGVVGGRLVGAAFWLVVAAPGLVGFLMAGQVDADGQRWFLVALQTPSAMVVGGVLLAAAVLVALAPLGRGS